MNTQKPPILLIGGGKMGTVLAKAWQARDIPLSLVEANPDRVAFLRDCLDGELVRVGAHIPTQGQWLVVLAVKPAHLGDVLRSCQGLAADSVFVSIAAGCSLLALKACFPAASPPLVRVMPNTPSAVGQGVSVGCAGGDVGPAPRRAVETLFGAVGDFLWVDDEDRLHAITALSGSGPAYVFLLAEVLAEAAAALGIDGAVAHRLARGVVSGAGALLGDVPQSPARLRDEVTSPGGVTEAALDVLTDKDAIKSLFLHALRQGAARSRQLGKAVETSLLN